MALDGTEPAPGRTPAASGCPFKTEVLGRFDALDHRLDAMDRRLDRVEADVREIVLHVDQQ